MQRLPSAGSRQLRGSRLVGGLQGCRSWFTRGVPPPEADLHEDLLKGIPPCCKDGQPEVLSPGWLAQHFRRLPLQQNKAGTSELPNGRQVWPGMDDLLYEALSELVWSISRKVAVDALRLALLSRPPRARAQ